MSYAVSMDAENVVCKIPLSEMGSLMKKFEDINKHENLIELNLEWEEDRSPITGKIVGDVIVLDAEQGGTFKNSSDGGLSYLLTTYKGSGTITETGEDDESEVTKYTNGKSKVGRIVFDDDEGEDGE
jgi:hypothetical protein